MDLVLEQKSETRMAAGVLKQDPNTSKVKKNAYLFGQKHNYFYGFEFCFRTLAVILVADIKTNCPQKHDSFAIVSKRDHS